MRSVLVAGVFGVVSWSCQSSATQNLSEIPQRAYSVRLGSVAPGQAEDVGGGLSKYFNEIRYSLGFIAKPQAAVACGGWIG